MTDLAFLIKDKGNNMKRLIIMVCISLFSQQVAYGMEDQKEDPKRFGPLRLPQAITDTEQQESTTLINTIIEQEKKEPSDRLRYVINPSNPSTYPDLRNKIACAIMCGKYHQLFINAADIKMDYYAWEHLFKNRHQIKEKHNVDVLYQETSYKLPNRLFRIDSLELFKLFASQDAIWIKQHDESNGNIFHSICRHRRSADTLEYCIAQFPDGVNATGINGFTPLQLLCYQTFESSHYQRRQSLPDVFEKIALLRKAKANFALKGYGGGTALDIVKVTIEAYKKEQAKYQDIQPPCEQETKMYSALAFYLEAVMEEQRTTMNGSK